ncbi:MAG: PIN domain-containing protein, partial [Nitrospirota bacterium]|nr:PIN domain-containing protein [Nitrospirota bacterium]
MESLRRVVIDTNLLVRYLTGDDPRKAKAVDNLLSKAEKGELKIFIPSIVIAELVWVLESFYQMHSSEIAELVEAV